eukprot:5096303-Pleurochrysis_carterae.AAC.1
MLCVSDAGLAYGIYHNNGNEQALSCVSKLGKGVCLFDARKLTAVRLMGPFVTEALAASFSLFASRLISAVVKKLYKGWVASPLAGVIRPKDTVGRG